MRLPFIMLLCLAASLPLCAQDTHISDPQIHTLQVVANGNELHPAIIRLGHNNRVEIRFDVLSHEYHRYIYKVEHCNADWTPSTELLESDYIEGFNGQPIEDYEKSFNTTLLYTHYSITLPNRDLSFKLSGNYRVRVYGDEEEDDPDTPVLTACFSVVEESISLGASVSSNTDIDFNKSHQQVSFAVNYQTLNVTDPHRELKTVVMQNRRTDNKVVNPKPDIQTTRSIEFNHCRQLIFPAGNEYHKFEILDMHTPNMGVDRLDWFDPYYHATLYENRTTLNYSFEHDQNGAYLIRNADNTDNATTSEYLFVHFRLKSKPLYGGEVYLSGGWTYNRFLPEYRMTYNTQEGVYEGTALLKQGYYNYCYLFKPDGEAPATTGPTDGNFYETENEYIILVYYRPVGARYDKLVGYRQLIFKPGN
ncbi:MAG: DUF5103 domain-containing protein [Clostridium sp.]|nr:DUF5103 domain-containing protein [Clostridium sp.]